MDIIKLKREMQEIITKHWFKKPNTEIPVKVMFNEEVVDVEDSEFIEEEGVFVLYI